MDFHNYSSLWCIVNSITYVHALPAPTFVNSCIPQFLLGNLAHTKHIHTWMYIHAHARTHACTHICTRTHRQAFMNTHLYTHTQASIHEHTYVHAHTSHTHMDTCACEVFMYMQVYTFWLVVFYTYVQKLSLL